MVETFESLHKGIRRLIIAIGFILPIVISIPFSYSAQYPEEVFFTTSMLSFISYWTLVGLSLWVYEGFQEDKRDEDED
ncbi:MAG: hypothetical protein WEA58_10850 [Balneolaceae bacterium]